MRSGIVHPEAIPAFGRARSICLLFFTLSIAILSLSNRAFGVELTLQWDASEGAHGYVLHYGARSQTYDTLIDVGPNLQHTVSGLEEGSSYYFAVTAYNEYADSCYSTEISHTPLHNQPPAAHAGSDMTVAEKSTVTLNGSDSFDPDDGIKTLHWEQLSGPAVELFDPEEDICRFVAPDIGSQSEELVFQVVVQDYGDQISSATCSVTVTPGTDTPTESGTPVTPPSPEEIDENGTPVETIEIQKAIYRSRRDRLIVRARVEGGGNDSNLTAWAVSGGREIKLGRLRYRARKGCFQSAFRNLDQAPDRIIIVSSSGSEASSACTIRR